MTSRERIRTTLTRREPDRVPRCEQSYWPDTLDRWRSEGMPEDKSPHELFDLDAFANLGLDNSLRLPPETLEETADWIVERDSDGVAHKRWKTRYGTPCEVDFLIKTRDDWERYRERLAPDPARISDGVRQAIVDYAAAGQFCTISPGEPVWWAISTLGMERAMLTLGSDPDLFADMLQAQATIALQMTRQLISEGYRPDGILFSPASYRALMMDYHKEYARLCHGNDMFLILHCDGDVRQFVPLLIEAGFDCIEPLEARAGNDVRELKPLYGDKISFFGNISMDVLATGDRGLIEREVASKMETAKVGGGYIHQSDHSVPPTVSYDSYRLWMDLAVEHGGYG